MIILLKKAFVFFIAGLAIAFVLQWIIDTGLRKSNYTVDYKDWYDITQGQASSAILIQGTSRARVQISPAAFEKQFKLSTYNLGMSGSAFGLQLYKLKQYLKHNHKPRYIIQAVDCNLFQYAKDVEFVQFIPYLNKQLINSFKGHFPYTETDLYLPLYKYRTAFGATTAGFSNFLNNTAKENGTYKGFRSFNMAYNNKALAGFLKQNATGTNAVIINEVYKQFIGFVQYCQKEHIKLILIWAPSLKQYQDKINNLPKINSVYSAIAHKYNLLYLNYSASPICGDTSLFFDYFHLNAKGVDIFNKQLITDLRTQIQ